MKSFPLFVALRYFLSRKNKHFINTIAIISMLAVAFGTAALVVILSVFNGFSATIENLFNSLDAEITLVPVEGKVFNYDQSLQESIHSVEGIASITEVIEDNILLRVKNQQKVVQMKAVSESFISERGIANNLLEGKPILKKGERNFAIIGLGVQYELGISLRNEFTYLQAWYPNRSVKHLGKNLSKSFSSLPIQASGVFQIEQEYDNNYIFVPLGFAKKLLKYETELSALEIKVDESHEVAAVIQALKEKVGEGFIVKDQLQLHASLYRAMKLEKVFVFAAILVVIAIAAINIFFSLSMLVIEKKKDIAMLFTLGAKRKTIRAVFLTEGLLIGLTGACLGLVVGFLVCFLQSEYGIIEMNVSTSIMNSYPVAMHLIDFVVVGLATFVITFLASILPAIKASVVDVDGLRNL
ncbi:MAG: FtsX-like permease family protein [Cyclobacteriaceae bacterium]